MGIESYGPGRGKDGYEAMRAIGGVQEGNTRGYGIVWELDGAAIGVGSPPGGIGAAAAIGVAGRLAERTSNDPCGKANEARTS